MKANKIACTLVRLYEERSGKYVKHGQNKQENRFVTEANKRYVRHLLSSIHFTRREQRVLKRLSKGKIELSIKDKDVYFLTSYMQDNDIGAIIDWEEDNKRLITANAKILHVLKITTLQQGIDYYGLESLTNLSKTN